MNDEIKEAITEEVEQIENLVEHPTTKKNKFVISMIVLAVVLTSVAFLIFRSKSASQNTEVNTDNNTKYSLAEISTHNSKDSCWTAINGEVFDVTKFTTKHKGGDKILRVCGVDGTDLFTGKSPMGRVHSEMAVKLLSSMKIGTLSN